MATKERLPRKSSFALSDKPDSGLKILLQMEESK